jgi:hypothetical protein
MNIQFFQLSEAPYNPRFERKEDSSGGGSEQCCQPSHSTSGRNDGKS